MIIIDLEEVRKAKEVLRKVIKESKYSTRGKTYTIKVTIDDSTRKKLLLNSKELGTTMEKIASYYVINGEEDELENLTEHLEEFNEGIRTTIESNNKIIVELRKQNEMLKDYRNRPQRITGKFTLPENINEIKNRHFEDMWRGGNITQMSKEQREHYYGIYIDKILDEYVLKELKEGNTFIFKERLRHLLIWDCVRFVRDKQIEKIGSE